MILIAVFLALVFAGPTLSLLSPRERTRNFYFELVAHDLAIQLLSVESAQLPDSIAEVAVSTPHIRQEAHLPVDPWDTGPGGEWTWVRFSQVHDAIGTMYVRAKPIKYRRLSDDLAILYSVGPDGVDDLAAYSDEAILAFHGRVQSGVLSWHDLPFRYDLEEPERGGDLFRFIERSRIEEREEDD